MNIDKTFGETLLRALEDAIRFSHMQDANYDIRKYQDLHRIIVRKLYRSEEMRNQNRLAHSILGGTDLGLFGAVSDIYLGKAKIINHFKDLIIKEKKLA